jgi:hypothetical protein
MGPIGLLRISALLSPFIFVVCNDFLLISFTTLITFAHGIYLSQWRLARAEVAEHLDILILRAMTGYFTIAAVISILQLPSTWNHLSQVHHPEEMDPRIATAFKMVSMGFHTLLPCSEARVLWKILGSLKKGTVDSTPVASTAPSPEGHGIVKPGSDAV